MTSFCTKSKTFWPEYPPMAALWLQITLPSQERGHQQISARNSERGKLTTIDRYIYRLHVKMHQTCLFYVLVDSRFHFYIMMKIFPSILNCLPLSALGHLFVIIECCKNRKVDIFLYIFIYFHLNESSLAGADQCSVSALRRAAGCGAPSCAECNKNWLIDDICIWKWAQQS